MNYKKHLLRTNTFALLARCSDEKNKHEEQHTSNLHRIHRLKRSSLGTQRWIDHMGVADTSEAIRQSCSLGPDGGCNVRVVHLGVDHKLHQSNTIVLLNEASIYIARQRDLLCETLQCSKATVT